MILEQYYLGCLAHASYLIADPDAGVAAVVDPQRDIDQYVADAEKLGVEITHVFLTHFHADYVAGHIELQERTGATIHLGAAAQAEYEFAAVADGDVVMIGSVEVKAMATPGHTPESTCYLVTEAGAAAPHAVLTGDTLFIGDVGRPDLMASIGVTAEELATQLYDSLHDKLLALPDETLVYPGHGAGSMCGKNLSTDTVSTIGKQRTENYALQPMSREAFVAQITADQPKAPDYFPHDAVLNRKQRPTLDVVLTRGTVPLSIEQLRHAMESGAQVLDTRDEHEFAEGHVRGSLNVGLLGKFATWAGTLLDLQAPIVILATPGTEQEAAMRLGRIGLDDLLGFVDGGYKAASKHADLVTTSGRVCVETAKSELAAGKAMLVDVRTPGEFANGHAEGAVHVPLIELADRTNELPRDRRLLVVCRSGYRSSAALSLLQAKGFEDIAHVIGGMNEWEGSDLTSCSI